MLSISDGVMRPKVSLELEDELSKTIHPQGTENGILHEKEVQLERLKGHVLEVRLHKSYLCVVGMESLRAVLVVQFVLHQENLELSGISPIKLVRFSDFSVGGRVSGGTWEYSGMT